MTAPTVDQIKRVLDVVNAGLDISDAIEAIWEDVPAPKAKKPDVMVTEFPSGLIIGWDTCRFGSGGCGEHVSRCKCKGGPQEPRVFAKWRAEEATMPAYRKAAGLPEENSSPTRTSVLAGGHDAPDAAVTHVTIPTNLVPCRDGQHLVEPEVADKNDDGSYTCHACQEAGSQAVQV